MSEFSIQFLTGGPHLMCVHQENSDHAQKPPELDKLCHKHATNLFGDF